MVTNNDAYRVYMILKALWSFGLTLAFTVNMVYLVLEMQLDPLQMVLVGTALELSAFLFEVPTGVVADTYSRRLSVIVGVGLMGASFLVFLVPSFAVILLSQVILGLGWTFVSGAESAWITDEIGEEAAGRAFLRGSQVGQVATIAAIVGSVLLATIDLRLPIALCGFVLMGTALYLLAVMPETGFTRAADTDRETIGGMLTTTRDGFRVIRGKPVLLTLMGIIFVWGAFSEGFDRLWTLHILENFALPTLGEMDMVLWFGVIGVVAMLISLIATEYLRRRVDTTDPVAIAKTLTIANTVLIMLLPIFALSGGFWLAIGAYWLIGAMRGVQYPLREAWINQGLNSRVRATVLSMTSQMDAVGQITAGPGIGWIGQQFGVRVALTLGSVILAPTLWLYGRTIRQNERIIQAA